MERDLCAAPNFELANVIRSEEGSNLRVTVFETVFELCWHTESYILLAFPPSKCASLASSAEQGGIVGRHSASALTSRLEGPEAG